MAQSNTSLLDIAPEIKTTHTRLLVSDFDAEFRFFKEVLGFTSTFGAEGESYADFDCAGINIALFKRDLMHDDLYGNSLPTAKESSDHLALIFGVQDLDETVALLKGKGVNFVREPHDRSDWGIRVAHFRDPDGNLIELNEALKP